jgi:hypothetical protein
MTAADPGGDAAFMEAFDSGHPEGGVFGHREHLRLAWILIDRYGLDAAAPEIERRLRHLAEAHGMPEKYNRTMTLFWVRLVAHVAARTPAATSAEFLDAEDWLLNPGLARRHYSAELLSSRRARAAWVDPDLIAMPA